MLIYICIILFLSFLTTNKVKTMGADKPNRISYIPNNKQSTTTKATRTKKQTRYKKVNRKIIRCYLYATWFSVIGKYKFC